MNGDARGEVFRILTAKGITYERFKSTAEVDVWLTRHTPEEA